MHNPYSLNKKLVRSAFDRSASRYDEVAILQHDIGQQLLERLDFILMEPQRILDLGAGTGICSAALAKKYKKAQTIALDLAPNMLREAKKRRGWFSKQSFLCADAEYLPLVDHSVDLIFSNFAIQWCGDLDQLFSEVRRVLRPGGLLMFSTLGPDTLKELRQSWQKTDDDIHVNAFMDMHDIGDGLLRSQLSDPVMDAATYTLTYKDTRALMSDLKVLGAHNVNQGRSHGLTGRQRIKTMTQHYEKFRQQDGLLPASYEVIFGLAWAPDEKQTVQRRQADGSITVPIKSFLTKK